MKIKKINGRKGFLCLQYFKLWSKKNGKYNEKQLPWKLIKTWTEKELYERIFVCIMDFLRRAKGNEHENEQKKYIKWNTIKRPELEWK